MEGAHLTPVNLVLLFSAWTEKHGLWVALWIVEIA